MINADYLPEPHPDDDGDIPYDETEAELVRWNNPLRPEDWLDYQDLSLY
jgi:hypothetical protein